MGPQRLSGAPTPFLSKPAPSPRRHLTDVVVQLGGISSGRLRTATSYYALNLPVTVSKPLGNWVARRCWNIEAAPAADNPLPRGSAIISNTNQCSHDAQSTCATWTRPSKIHATQTNAKRVPGGHAGQKPDVGLCRWALDAYSEKASACSRLPALHYRHAEQIGGLHTTQKWRHEER